MSHFKAVLYHAAVAGSHPIPSEACNDQCLQKLNSLSFFRVAVRTKVMNCLREPLVNFSGLTESGTESQVFVAQFTDAVFLFAAYA